MLAFVPAPRVADAAKRALLKPKAGVAEKPGLSPAFARAAQDLEARWAARDQSAIVAKVDERLATIASEAGLALPPSATNDDGIQTWLAALATAVHPHLKTPLLETAWQAGEVARHVVISVELLKEVTHRRVANPDDVDLRAKAAELARELLESTANLRLRLEQTGLPEVIEHAGAHEEMARLVKLDRTTKGGWEEITVLAKDMASFSESTARRLDEAMKPQAPPSPADLVKEQLEKLEELGVHIDRNAKVADEIWIDAETFIDNARLFAIAPITKVHIRAALGGFVRQVMASDLLATIELLDITAEDVDDEDLQRLALSSYASKLRVLELRHNKITMRGLEALTSSSHLKALEKVELEGNPVDIAEAAKTLEPKYGWLRWLHGGEPPPAPSPEQQRLSRLTSVLDQFGIPIEPVLRVVAAVGIESVYVGIGTLSQRVQLLVPCNAASLGLVASVTTAPQRSMLLVSAQRKEPLSGAIVIGGPTTPAEAIEQVSPRSARDLWLPVVEALPEGSIKNRTTHLSEDRGTITISFRARSDDAEHARFIAALAKVLSPLGVAPTWQRVLEHVGHVADVSVTTECGRAGPLPRIVLRFGPATWDSAIDVAKVMVDIDGARTAAVRMGMLASTFATNEMRGLDAVIDADTPDLIAWLAL